MLPYKKIFIDSRNKVSGDSSNFKVELNYSETLPDNCAFFITDVCIPPVWKTLEEHINARLYVLQAQIPITLLLN